VDIILSQKHPGFVQKLIDLLGYEENKVITSNHLPIKAKNVLVPSHPEPTPLSLRWLRSTVLSNIDYVSVSDRIKKIASEYDTIFVSRQKSDRRYIENYNEVESVLHKNDIKPIFLEDITIESEIYLLNSISRIIGAHGAGLTCMIWTEDLHTLEIFNGQVIPPFYILSEHLGHEYTAILGEHSNEELTRHSNVIVDVEELQDKL
jgi:capsular polysaccharide biosynthesis protein